YLVIPEQTGFDTIYDTGELVVQGDDGGVRSAYRDWYYKSIGIMDYYPHTFDGTLPQLPEISPNDYQALAPLYAANVIEKDTVEFGQGITLQDLSFSWEQVTLDSAYTALTISWAPDRGVKVAIPHSLQNNELGWERVLGLGIEQFKFADGTVLSMGQMIALAPPPPTFDPQLAGSANAAPTGTVTLTGTATQNQTLTAANTLADADGLGAIAYQWQSSADSGTTWSNITGATSDAFSLAEAQVGKQVRVNASYTDGHGMAESVNSSATTAVVNVNDTPTGSVTLSGTATQNQTLTAANTLADADGLGAIGYQWQSSADSGATWSNITGAMAGTFSLAEAQVGKQVRVKASYTDGH
ncbi:MAG: hypothetical protein Q8N51_18180, partial [Gammaproteobacteria bacterium]|nr:hypothetical protein [Gammaproteobacteria bacterium]